MVTVDGSVPWSPKGAFGEAVASLTSTLGDEAATVREIVDGFAEVLDRLECVAVEKSIYAAAKAVLVASLRDCCSEMLDGSPGMGVRRGAAKDIDIHGQKVLSHAWL
jgi:hypothetical protein